MIAKSRCGVVLGERARRLVEDDHPGVGDEGPGHLDELLRAHAQVAEHRLGPDVGMVEQLKSLAPRSARCSRRRINPARTRSWPSMTLASTRQVRRQGQLLVDHRHAGRSCLARPLGRVRLAPQRHRARVGPDRAAEDLHQRALARPVLADQGMDFARVDAQRDAVESPRRPERLGHPRHFEQHARIVALYASPRQHPRPFECPQHPDRARLVGTEDPVDLPAIPRHQALRLLLGRVRRRAGVFRCPREK